MSAFFSIITGIFLCLSSCSMDIMERAIAPATSLTTQEKFQQANPVTLYPIQWNSKLRLSSLADVDKRLTESFDDGPFNVRRFPSQEDLVHKKNAEVTIITNCENYLDLTKRGFQSPTDMEWRVLLLRGAECYSLAALKTAAPARSTYLKSFRLDGSAPDFLPPSSGAVITPDDVRGVSAAEVKELSWKQYEPKMQIRHEEAGVLIVEGEGWRSQLEIYARGDFNEDGVEDLLLKKESIMKEGTYHSTRLLLLTRFREDVVLKVIRQFP